MIDLEYFTKELKADGFEVVVFIDVKERADSHQHKYKSDNGLHIDGSIDCSIANYVINCVLSNILAEHHAELDTEITNTNLGGSTQINFVLATPVIALFIGKSGLLYFDVIF
jgi:hypothetical protein